MLLIARSKAKLQSLAQQLSSAEVLSVDLAQPSAWTQVSEVMQGRHWSVLVNNAGALDFRDFAHLSVTEVNTALALHVQALVTLSHAFLTSGPQRKALINLSSLSAEVPFPKLALYSGAKSFVSGFSQALARESSADVLCVAPVFVSSAMTWGFGVESAEHLAACVLNCVGRTHWSAGSLRQEALHWLAASLPRAAVQALFASVARVAQLLNRR